jgi:hypothetical protein
MGDCRARGVIAHPGLVSFQKPGPVSPEKEKFGAEAAGARGDWADVGIPQTSDDTKAARRRPIFGFIHIFFLGEA